MFTGLGSGPAKGCAAQFLARHLAFGIWLGPWGEGRALGLQNATALTSFALLPCSSFHLHTRPILAARPTF